jgi:outer membrane immunogenic protein
MLAMGDTIMIKRILFSIVAIATSTIGVFAADLPSRAPAPAFIPPPIFSWTGFYVGGQVGYQWATSSPQIYSTTGAATAGSPNYNQQGVIGGGHIGYNYQINQYVLGIEGDVEASSFKGSGPYASGLYTFNTSVDVQGSVRGRLGFTWERALIYATGGAAFAPVHSSYLGPAGFDDVTSTRTGWTVGGGFQYAFTPNWSARIEYRYTDLGTTNNILANSSGGTLGETKHETANAVRVGFSYKFDMYAPPRPIVAKY